MKTKIYRLMVLSLALILLTNAAVNALAADAAFKQGLAYLLSGSNVYADPEGREALFQVQGDTGIYIVENATGSAKTMKSNDMLKAVIAVNSAAQDVYVWAYDIQYMSKNDQRNYNPGKGIGIYGVTLGNAVTQEAPTPRPVITRDPSRVITNAPYSTPARSTNTPAGRKSTTPAAAVTPRPTPAPTSTPEPVFAAFIVVQPQQIIGQIGMPVTAKVIAENVVKFQWQFKEAEKDWMNLPNNETYSGSQTAEMVFTLTEENAAWQYRCLISGAENSLITDEVGVTLSTTLNILQQPVDQVVKAGAEAVFTVKAVNAAKWLWQSSKAQDEWVDIEGEAVQPIDENSCQLTVLADNSAKGVKYRCVVTGIEGDEMITDEVSVITGAAAMITLQPENVTAANGTYAVLHVEAENAVSYQWQYDDGISDWWDLVERDDRIGTNSDTLTILVRPTMATFKYRCVITGVENTVATKAVTIKIK